MYTFANIFKSIERNKKNQVNSLNISSKTTSMVSPMFSHPNQNMVGRHASRRQQTSIGTPRQRIDGGVLLIVRTEKFTPGVFLIFWVVLIAGVGGAGQTPKTNPGLTTDSQTSAAQRLPFHAGDVPLKLMFPEAKILG